MIKFENGRVYRAGENEFYRWGKKARERATAALTPNKKGFYSIPADGGRYWTFGTSIGKYGEFMRWKETCFSVNSVGNAWVKVGTPKAEKFIEMISELIEKMKELCKADDDDE